MIIIQPNCRKCHFTLLSQGFEKNDKPKRVETQSTYGPNVFLTKPEVSEGDPPTDTKELITISLIQGVPSEETDRHTHIKVSISISRMDITLGPSLLSLEYFL